MKAILNGKATIQPEMEHTYAGDEYDQVGTSTRSLRARFRLLLNGKQRSPR